jgi:histone H3/H4
MQTQITLDLAADEFVHARQATLQAGFQLEEYLNFVLKAISIPKQLNEDVIERIFHLLPDALVMQLAKSKMTDKDSKLFSRLLEKQREDKISKSERERLTELTEEYERDTLRKAYALAESVRRGLMPPLHA